MMDVLKSGLHNFNPYIHLFNFNLTPNHQLQPIDTAEHGVRVRHEVA